MPRARAALVGVFLSVVVTASGQPASPQRSEEGGLKRVDRPAASRAPAQADVARPDGRQDDEGRRSRTPRPPELVPRARASGRVEVAPLEMDKPGVLIAASRNPPPSPDPSLVLTPPLEGVDPMIAVGHKSLIVSQDHRWAYYDKAGNLLPGAPSEVSSTDFFTPVIDAANQTFALANAPNSVLTNCNDGKPNPTKLISEAYDTRVAYEPVNRRFVILSALRNQLWRDGSDLCRDWSVRTFAFAVSNTDNPMDGFMMWFWTKNNYRDWPRMSVDEDVVTVAHNAEGDPGTPSIHVISLQDMIAGSSDPRWYTYKSGSGGTPNAVLPVAKYKTPNHTAFDDYLLFLRADGDNVFLHYLKKNGAGLWIVKPALGETDTDLDNDATFAWHERPVLRQGKLYFTSRVVTAEAEEDVRPRSYGFDLYRLPLKKDGNKLEFDEASAKRLEYPVYPGDPDGNRFVSYEAPSLSVDVRGTIMTAYGRIGRTAQGDIAPEARYFVFKEAETKHRPSRQLQAGQFMPVFTPTGWDQSVPDGHYNYNGPNDVDTFVDYTTVVPDPAQRLAFWIAHAYADSKTMKYAIVVGRVLAP